MEDANRWYFTKEQLENSPTRKCGIEASKELSYRQQGANFIQDMGQRLQVTQLCINTAIVYMHRFYVFHSFQRLHRNQLAVAALFLAAKVEEQPRKLEHVVRVAHKCLHRGEDLDPKCEEFLKKCGDLVFHENMMLQTLGFDIAIDHPHTYVVKLLQLVKDSPVQNEVYIQVSGGVRFCVRPINGRKTRPPAGQNANELSTETFARATKDLAQTSYFMATNSLHLTTMCLQYRPTVVACVCIHLACKWSDWKIEPCSEGKEWYYYVDKSVTPELLEELTKDFLAVLEKSPNRLKRRSGPENNKDSQSAQFKSGDEIITRMDSLTYDNCIDLPKGTLSPVPSISSAVAKEEKTGEASAVPETTVSPPARKPKVEVPHSISLSVYREKREKERQSEQKAAAPMELPLPPIARSVAPDKHSAVSKEKRKTETLSSDLVPQKTAEVKNSKKRPPLSSSAETTSSEKVNHQISRVAVVPPTHPKNSVTVNKSDGGKTAPDGLKGDPFVLLTRLDQTHITKKVGELKTPHQAQSVKASLQAASPLDGKRIPESKPPSAHPAPSVNACDIPKSVAKSMDSHPAASARAKHTKQKAPALLNSHSNAQLVTQGNLPKQSPSWELGKTNGSSIQPAVDSRVPPPPPSQPAEVTSKVPDKIIELQVKHEKKEKHRHKHSVHSSKEKISNHVLDATSEPILPGSIKITIPKDKIVLSGVHDAKVNASHNSPRTSLKIKIPKPKPQPPEQSVVKANPSTGLKLVITKDKNAGSYSATRKAERASRKRERSPSSKEHNSRSSAKQNKTEHGSQIERIPASDAETRNCVTWNATLHQDGAYHQNNVGQQPYAMPAGYNPQLYYQQPYYNYPITPANMQYGRMPPPLPPAPPTSNSAPPLPRDPPPPLPPQPPLPLE